jgi:hypothetical protein
MSIHQAPFKNPTYIMLNQRESNVISPLRDKQQGLNKSSDRWCNICNRPLKYNNQELCYKCRNHLIRGTLFPEFGELIVTLEDNHKRYNKFVSEELVSKLDDVLGGKFRTRTYKNKTSRMICVLYKFLEAKGDIEIDLCYRRLRYYANTSRRGSLQQTLQDGKKLFNILTRYLHI